MLYILFLITRISYLSKTLLLSQNPGFPLEAPSGQIPLRRLSIDLLTPATAFLPPDARVWWAQLALLLVLCPIGEQIARP